MKKQDYIFLIEFSPSSKSNCNSLIKAVKSCKSFIKEIRYSIPKNATRN